MIADLKYFARIWDKNIKDQGFVAAAIKLATAQATAKLSGK